MKKNPKRNDEMTEVFSNLYILKPLEKDRYRLLDSRVFWGGTDLGAKGNGVGDLTYREVQNLEDKGMIVLDGEQFETYGRPALEGDAQPYWSRGLPRHTDLGEVAAAAHEREEWTGRLPE